MAGAPTHVYVLKSWSIAPLTQFCSPYWQGERYSWPGDVWSAGLIMLECAYGRHPYTSLGDKCGFLEMTEYTRTCPTPPMPQV
jgi:serine/threonine protein kinase